MKILFKIVIAVSLIASFTGISNASDRGTRGLIIGGGAGAIMGQAVGRNVESTIIGATVGGILGAVIGTEKSHSHHKNIIIQQTVSGKNGRHYSKHTRLDSPRFIHKRPHVRGQYYQRETIVVHKQKGKNKVSYHNHKPRRENMYSHSTNNHRRPFKNSNRW